MDSNCDMMRERIADLVTGILSEAQIQTVRQHLSECSACREYADALEREDQLLAGLFGEYDGSMKGWEDAVIDTVSCVGTSGQGSIISAGGAIVRSLFSKHAAAAAVIVVVTLYFIITLSWVSQINEVIRHGL